MVEQLTEQMIEILNEQMNMQASLLANQRMTGQILAQMDDLDRHLPPPRSNLGGRFRDSCIVM
jgi:hypothetical protein